MEARKSQCEGSLKVSGSETPTPPDNSWQSFLEKFKIWRVCWNFGEMFKEFGKSGEGNL